MNTKNKMLIGIVRFVFGVVAALVALLLFMVACWALSADYEDAKFFAGWFCGITYSAVVSAFDEVINEENKEG